MCEECERDAAVLAELGVKAPDEVTDADMAMYDQAWAKVRDIFATLVGMRVAFLDEVGDTLMHPAATSQELILAMNELDRDQMCALLNFAINLTAVEYRAERT